MLEIAQKLADGLDLSQGQETSIKCFHEAKTALLSIQKIMRTASNFWKNIEHHCENMTEHILNREIELLSKTDISAKQRMYKSETFKQAALAYSGQWQAIKNTCAIASKNITLVQDEINQYICGNPTKEEAQILVKQLAQELLDSKSFISVTSDKPVNN